MGGEGDKYGSERGQNQHEQNGPERGARCGFGAERKKERAPKRGEGRADVADHRDDDQDECEFETVWTLRKPRGEEISDQFADHEDGERTPGQAEKRGSVEGEKLLPGKWRDQEYFEHAGATGLNEETGGATREQEKNDESHAETKPCEEGNFGIETGVERERGGKLQVGAGDAEPGQEQRFARVRGEALLQRINMFGEATACLCKGGGSWRRRFGGEIAVEITLGPGGNEVGEGPRGTEEMKGDSDEDEEFSPEEIELQNLDRAEQAVRTGESFKQHRSGTGRREAQGPDRQDEEGEHGAFAGAFCFCGEFVGSGELARVALAVQDAEINNTVNAAGEDDPGVGERLLERAGGGGGGAGSVNGDAEGKKKRGEEDERHLNDLKGSYAAEEEGKGEERSGGDESKDSGKGIAEELAHDEIELAHAGDLEERESAVAALGGDGFGGEEKTGEGGVEKKNKRDGSENGPADAGGRFAGGDQQGNQEQPQGRGDQAAPGQDWPARSDDQFSVRDGEPHDRERIGHPGPIAKRIAKFEARFGPIRFRC